MSHVLFQAASVLSHMSVQHLLKHLECCSPVLLACNRLWRDTVTLRSSDPGTHTYFAISFQTTRKWKPPFRKSDYSLIAICNIQEVWYKIFSWPPLELWFSQTRLGSVRMHYHKMARWAWAVVASCGPTATAAPDSQLRLVFRWEGLFVYVQPH